MDRLGVSGKARGQHRNRDFRDVRAVRIPRARGSLRKLETADVGNPRSAARAPLRGRRGLLEGHGQQYYDANRIRRVNWACVQERNPYRGIRKTKTGKGRGNRLERKQRVQKPFAPDFDDFVRIHLGRRSARIRDGVQSCF